MFRFLEEWEPCDMDTAIKHNVLIDKSVVLSYIDSITNSISDELLKLFQTYRSDLYERIKQKEGRKWLKNNIMQVIQT